MTGFARKLLIVTVIGAAIMELIDTSIVNVALNYMSGNLGSTLEDTAWVITSYAIANVIVIPMTSFLTNLLGRRRYYIGSIILFVFCSYMCGQAGSIWVLVFFRFWQGMGGGALLSVSAAVVYEQFPKEKLGLASALFGIGIFIGPTIGPTLGGFIVENYSWPWIFYINVPIGIATAISCYFLLPEAPNRVVNGNGSSKPKIDWLGIILLTLGVGSLQTILERGQTDDWFAATYIVVLAVTAAISLTGFILWELHVPNPVVNLRVFKSRTLMIAAVLTFVSGLGLFTTVFLTPVFAQRLLGFTPSQTGLLLLPGAILALVALVGSGRLLQKGVSPTILIAVGFVLFIFFNWQMSLMSLDTSARTISLTLIIRAVGIALLTVPLSSLAVSSLPQADIPQGTALNNMMRQLGGSFGISIVNTYSARRTALHRTDMLANITDINPLVHDRITHYTTYFQDKGKTLWDAKRLAVDAIDIAVVKQSTLLSYLDSYLLIGLLFAITLPLLLFAVKRNKGKTTNVIVQDH
ncbi:DHA2 family efflux MFS transporter permease subunit [Mucilaginibacter sp. McL0603]|uniref:DHA2 family efflux MFS transporter permease subunit n=1 Tax=Mucilaginibacter sp. McL0603 TaxID=3415670 RepID=UPI003CF1324B